MDTHLSPDAESRLQRSAFIWLVDGSNWPDDTLLPWLACLTAAEQQRYRCFIRPMRQRQFLIGRILLRFAAARLTNLAIDDISVIERKNNAPLPVLRQNNPVAAKVLPFLSLSHSREWVACGVSADTPLGLDVEMLDTSRDVAALAAAAFTACENQWLSVQGSTADAGKVAAFYALWTAKEALYKLASNGERQAEGEILVKDGIQLTSGPNWTLQSPLHTQLAICLCTRHLVSPLDVIALTGDSPFSWALHADNLEEDQKRWNEDGVSAP
ncbi:4'-phosphopantetheinyl transferase superfamily protein [Glaciimonas sp. PAMC28666]|uniref:4'-phosphopantetheinyl transferase family protein n=1 Tax=Glaciimonas sp. PAMC28666 TaxID=2807626 RepID=UPI0019630BDE|nr:4'-phosphopantetheinyl transferase superfamily protein [Glaciimonas sp. PAMC28666]QRX83014.1 4'-phosphopantetheinyl transferase superfamily protein [Glaciimonas sp. PAMC28666]